jgi:hypothetical protein
MRLQWEMLWVHALANSRDRRRGPMSDPLEGPEWEGLAWTIPLVASLLGRMRPSVTYRADDTKPATTRFGPRLISPRDARG